MTQVFDADRFFHVLPVQGGYHFVNRNGTPFAVTVLAEHGEMILRVRGQVQGRFHTVPASMKAAMEKLPNQAQPCLKGKGSKLKGSVTAQVAKYFE